MKIWKITYKTAEQLQALRVAAAMNGQPNLESENQSVVLPNTLYTANAVAVAAKLDSLEITEFNGEWSHPAPPARKCHKCSEGVQVPYNMYTVDTDWQGNDTHVKVTRYLCNVCDMPKVPKKSTIDRLLGR